MQFRKAHALTLAISALTSAMTMASQADSNGFIEDSHLDLLARNFFLDNNNRDIDSDRREWAQALLLNYKSGYTQGTVGFGVDLHAYAGLKLDSSGKGGTQLLPPESDGDAAKDVSVLGGAVKMRVSNTELKYGSLTPYNPVFAPADSRLLPATVTGFQLTSKEFAPLALEAGHFTAAKDMNRAHSDGDFLAAYTYGAAASDSVDYLGGTYTVNDQLNFTLYASEFQDIWRQYYGNANYTLAFNDTQKLNFDFNIYRSLDEGQARAGEIDVTAWSLGLAYTFSAHTFGVSYQAIHGDQPLDYLGLDGGRAQDSIYLNNASQYADFNGPNERSWQVRYTLDMASYGVPGLSFMTRYTRGDDIDGSHMDATSPYNYYADNEKHWERDFDIKYVVQSGSAKDLSIRLRQATHRISGTSDNDIDQLRLIVQYPYSFF